MEIIRTTPSSIKVKVGDRVAKLAGESFARGYGSPDFIIDSSSLKHWEEPLEDIPVSDLERREIIEFAIVTLRARGWDIMCE